jgi:hypothetical protein
VRGKREYLRELFLVIIINFGVLLSDICNKHREKYDDVSSISKMNKAVLNWFSSLVEEYPYA